MGTSGVPWYLLFDSDTSDPLRYCSCGDGHKTVCSRRRRFVGKMPGVMVGPCIATTYLRLKLSVHRVTEKTTEARYNTEKKNPSSLPYAASRRFPLELVSNSLKTTESRYLNSFISRDISAEGIRGAGQRKKRASNKLRNVALSSSASFTSLSPVMGRATLATVLRCKS